MFVGEINFYHTSMFLLLLKNVIIPNYKGCKLLTFIEENRRASKHVHKCMLKG